MDMLGKCDFMARQREGIVWMRKPMQLISTDQAPARLTRRQVLLGAGSVVTVGWTSSSTPACAQKDAVLKFGLTPVFLSNDLDLLAALRSYLEEATGHKVQLIQRRTYQEITSLLISGQLHAAWICGFPYISNREQLSLLAVPLWRGKPLYQAYLITSQRRQANGIDDLKGDIHAFSDPDSNSGYLVTSALLAERGLKPADYFSRTFFTYGHRNVVRAVAAGLAQSGSVDGYVWDVMRELEPALTSRTKVIQRSEWLGFPPIATSHSMANDSQVQNLGRAFLQMASNEKGRKVLRLLRLDGFALSPDMTFARIAQKVALVRGLE